MGEPMRENDVKPWGDVAEERGRTEYSIVTSDYFVVDSADFDGN